MPSISLLSNFQQIVLPEYPDLKSDLFTDIHGNGALEITSVGMSPEFLNVILF